MYQSLGGWPVYQVDVIFEIALLFLKIFEENIEPSGKRFYELFKCPNANVEAAENSGDISVAGTRSRIVCLALQRAFVNQHLCFLNGAAGDTFNAPVALTNCISVTALSDLATRTLICRCAIRFDLMF
ncbi:hypothetical protein CEXT_259481 [Caerostris extrusa]|uniref:Uncharacterized protein n=1 Tax=Caerostris extrusa TaxID=172846 RepID=A0AAV4WF80_CAEEX|nr:hypothetical protein CEXT_259481 [Caerostris extrusa]